METVKFVCEFFFTNFWHWLGLVTILSVVFRFSFIRLNLGSNDKNKNEE